MKNTVGYLIEPLFSQFFLIDSICNGFINESERKNIFNDLANVFCIPVDENTEKYFSVAESSQYKNILDYSSYERLCRTIEFAEISGQEVDLTEIDRIILAQKREAMLIKSEIFKQSKNLTAESVADTLLNIAMNGNIDAMATLAYMEYHGICICEDKKRALKRFRLCAQWNHLFGNLMGIAYDEENKADYFNTLYTMLRSADQREVFKYICEFKGYSENCEKLPVARIIDKAFGLGIIRRNVYDQTFAKVAFSELVSDKDKEKLLLNKKRDAIISLSDFPFDARRNVEYAFDNEAVEEVALKRDGEMHKILCALSPAVNGCHELYRTLLVETEDEYISEMYVDVLRKGFEKQNKVIEVDASTLTPADFAGSKENFILRGLSETKQSHTVFLVKNCNEIESGELNELVKLLDYEYRRKFKLVEPTVSLDLSDVLIVLFASEINDLVGSLAEECDVVQTEGINNSEKHTVIDSTFRARSQKFGIGRVELEEEGKKYLAPFSSGQIMRIIDSALKKAAYENESIITAEALKTISNQQNIAKPRREFGYLGGAIDEKY